MTSARRPDEESRRPAGAPDEQVGKEPAADRAAVDAKLSDTETNASADAESGSAAAVDADLDALLADVRRERDKYLEIAQRARADFENYRKRAAREAQEAERRGKAAVAHERLPALDNLERALRSTGLDPASGRPVAKPAAPGREAGSTADPAAPGREAEEAAGIEFDAEVYDT